MRVIDSLNGLRHHPVIGSHDQHHNVRCLRAAGPHASESLVTRRIEEHNLASVGWRFFIGDANFVGADVLGDASSFAFRNGSLANRVQQRGLAMIDVAHDRNHRWARRHLDSGLFPASGGSVNVFRSLLFERDHVGLGAEEACHLTRQFGVERLVNRSENPAAQQSRDQIFRADIQLLRQILNANAFRDRDIARDRHRLIRHHHTRRWRVALHGAFFYATRNVALAGAARRRTRATAGANWPWRRKPRTDTKRTRTRRRLARGMHWTTFAWAQRARRTSAGNLWTRALKNWLSRHRTPRSGTHSSRRSACLRNRRNRTRRRSFVHRARPSLRNNHARRGRLCNCHWRRRTCSDWSLRRGRSYHRRRSRYRRLDGGRCRRSCRSCWCNNSRSSRNDSCGRVGSRPLRRRRDHFRSWSGRWRRNGRRGNWRRDGRRCWSRYRRRRRSRWLGGYRRRGGPKRSRCRFLLLGDGFEHISGPGDM